MIASPDWGLWGSVIAVAGIVVAAVVAIGIYLRSKATSIAVSATVDKTGLVHVLIKKTGMPAVHVRDVKLLRAGTNKTLPIRSRYPVGEFDITAAGDTAYDCYCLLDNAGPAGDGVDVQVWLAAKTKRAVTATSIDQAIKLPDGVILKLVPADRWA
jgi:hypothetical protein